MYRIKYNNAVLYDPRLPSRPISYGVMKRVVNRAGSFVFTMPKVNEEYNTPKKLSGTVRLYEDDNEIFRGRVINEEFDIRKSRKLSCEGALAFFNDSIVRPYEYSGSVHGYLEMLVSQHNSQVNADRRFTVGNVTVTDSNDYIVRANSNYPDTWSEIEDKLLDNKGLGGYLLCRYEDGNDNTIIDYLAEVSASNDQEARFGSNILDLSWIRKGEDIATVIVPVGARDEETEERLTIKSVNGGLDYIEDAQAIAKYGRIQKTVIYNDVTVASNLLSKAQNDLAKGVIEAETYNIRAADLSKAGYNIGTFRFGEKLKVRSSYHGIGIELLVSNMTTDLLHPEQNVITLGSEKLGFTSMQSAAIKRSGSDMLERAMSSQEAAQRHLEELVRNSSGLYFTPVEQEDESIINYAHDKRRLDESTLIIMIGDEAIAISNDGGETWPYGFAYDGTAILDKLYAVGINAEHVNIGNKSIVETLNDDYCTESETEQKISAGMGQVESTVTQKFPVVNICPAVYARENASGNPWTVNGLTFTRNADGSVTVTGTATAPTYYTISGTAKNTDVPVIFTDPSKKYRLSGAPASSSGNMWTLNARCTVEGTEPSASSGTVYSDRGSGVTVPAGYRYVHIFIAIANGAALPAGGATFFPMFEEGEVTHPYSSPNIGAIITRVAQNAHEISLKVSASEYTASNIVNKINGSSLKIDPKNISLTGMTISLTADNINIASTNFSVSNTGIIMAKGGELAGWKFVSDAIYKYTNYTEGTASTGAYLKKLWATPNANDSGWAFSVQKCDYNGSTFSNYSNQFFIQNNGFIYAGGGGQIGAWNLQSDGSGGALYSGMVSLTDTAHNGAYLGTNGIAFGKATVWIKNDGSFRFGAIRSVESTGANDDAWITNALHVSYGCEIYSDNLNSEPYVDFRRDADGPLATTTYDYTARISNTSDSVITVQGRKTKNSTTAAASTVVVGTLTQTSDRRLKKYISSVNADAAEQFIMALKPSRFEYRQDNKIFHHGFIYDEVEEAKYEDDWVVATTVENMFGDGESYGTVTGIEIIPDIVAAMQKQIMMIKELGDRLSVFEAQA